MSRVPCGKTMGHGESCVEGYMCDSCTHIIRTERVMVDIRALLHEVQAFTSLITGSVPSTEIRGEIEATALHIGHHPFVLNPHSTEVK